MRLKRAPTPQRPAPHRTPYRSVPPATAGPHRVSSLQGTRMAHMCHRQQPPPFVAKPIYAGRPACLHRRAYVFSGAPKGIRILIALVLVGTRWDSLVLLSCGESQ